MFQVLVIPLRQLYLKYIRKPIPPAMWTPELLDLFELLKVAITSSPVLARYNSSLPTFLKTDWSAVGMDFIIMQTNNDKVSLDALELLRTTGENNFDKSMNSPRLRPILFGSRKYTATESHYHSFVGEVATGRWAISENRAYFWGTHFYWICGMKTVYKILNYEGPIHLISRWEQEISSIFFDMRALSKLNDG